MRNNRAPLLATLAVLFVAIIGLAALSALNKPDNRSYKRVTSNVQQGWLTKQHLYFFTGSFFASYNFSSDSIDRLGGYVFIQNGISSPSWSSDAVVFRTSPTSNTRDDITTAAAQLGANPSSPHWWRYSFSDGQYQLLEFQNIDACDNLAQLNNNELVCSNSGSNDDSKDTLRLLTISSRSSKELFSSEDAISNVSATQHAIYFVITSLGGKDTLYKIEDGSGAKSTVYQGQGVVNYQAYDDGSVLVDDSNGANGDLHEDTASTAAKHTVALVKNGSTVKKKGFTTLPLHIYATQADTPAFSSLDGSVYEVTDQGFKKIFTKLPKPLGTNDFLFHLDDTRSYILSDSNVLSASPAVNGRSYRQTSSFDVQRDNDPDGSWVLQPSTGGKRNGFLYRTDVGVATQEENVFKRLYAVGFRPSEFDINWVIDGVDFSAPVQPNATAIN